MNNQEKFIKMSADLHDEAKKITLEQNCKYSPGDDPLSNFRDYELTGIMCEIGNIKSKLMNHERSIMLKGVEPFSENDLKNACLDLANFAIMYFILYKDKKENLFKK